VSKIFLQLILLLTDYVSSVIKLKEEAVPNFSQSDEHSKSSSLCMTSICEVPVMMCLLHQKLKSDINVKFV